MLETVLLASLLAQDVFVEGNPRATVRVLIYDEVQSSECAGFQIMLDTYLLPKYKDKVAFERRDFALPKHPWSRRAAVAARHFDHVRPGAGGDFRRYVFERLRSTDTETLDERIREFARQEGLDPIDAMRAAGSPELEAAVDRDYKEGAARGVSKTPTVYIGEKAFVERFGRAQITDAIDRALALEATEPSAKR
jgi:protein-disulfide isomerase